MWQKLLLLLVNVGDWFDQVFHSDCVWRWRWRWGTARRRRRRQLERNRRRRQKPAPPK